LNRSQVSLAVALALFFQFGCGGEESPTTTDVVAIPPTTQPPAPATNPTAAPAPSGLCANGNVPVAAFDTKVYTVKMPNGDFREFEGWGPFYVGEELRLDSQGKDRFGRRTEGCEEPRWDWWEDDQGMLNSTKGWMPKVRVISPGKFYVDANHDHIEAREILELDFRPAAEAPYYNK